jgi:magnesium-transporting ATPase (P-type)
MWIQTDANSLVRGDIVRLMKGDRIPADARLVKVGEGFCCDDSVLLGGRDGDSSAGQHQLIYKPGDLVFCSSYITEGKAHAVIIATGQHTLIGKLIGRKAWPPTTNKKYKSS